MIQTIDLTMRYKKHEAVSKLNMHIERGERIGLVGPNGAGKSTTISMISSLLSPTSGDILLDGKSTLKNPAPIRKILGIVPQHIALYPDLTAKENLAFFGRIQKLKGPVLKERIQRVLKDIGLEERQNDLVKTFSGGMQRQLNIAIALLHEPEILIMDEPTVGIDTQSRNYILEKVLELNEKHGMTILYTSHYMEEVETICNRLYIMDQGGIVASGTKDEIKAILSSEVTVEVEVDQAHEAFVQALNEEPAVIRATGEDARITIVAAKQAPIASIVFHLAESMNLALLRVEVQQPSLEDVFLHLTGKALRQ